MFEWLDGYWTAMRHVAKAAPLVGQNPHWTVVVTAWGTIAAVAVTSISGVATWLSAQKSMKQTADAYHKDQRPWISAAVTITDGLSCSKINGPESLAPLLNMNRHMTLLKNQKIRACL